MSPPRLTPEQIQDLMEFYGDPQSERSIAERPYEAPILRPIDVLAGPGGAYFDLAMPMRRQDGSPSDLVMAHEANREGIWLPSHISLRDDPPSPRPSTDLADFQAGQMLIPVEASNALARSVAQARQARAGGGAAVPPPPPAPTAPAAEPGDTARARVDMETGSQGRTTPSNAADAASVGTRISKYLEQSVGRLAGEQQGFGDIANALMQVRATGGKVNFEQAMRDIEAKDFNRATNLANAYAALKRADGSGQLSLKDQALIEQRKLDRAAREGNQAAVQLNNAINSAVKDYSRADQPRIREEIMTTIAAWRLSNEGRDAAPAQVPEIMRDVLNHVNRLGYRRVGGGGGGGAQAAGPSGGGIYMDDEVQRFLPFVSQGRGGLSQQQQAANRAFERGDEQMALSIARNIESRAAGAGGGRGAGGAGAERELGKFREQLAAARTTIDLMDDIRSQIDQRGASIMGASGSLSNIVNGLSAQAQAIIGIGDIRERTRNVANSFNRELVNAQVRNPEEAEANQRLRRSFAWLEGDNSAEATAFRSNMLILGTSLAKALDPSGRLSNQDVQQALAIIGQQGRGVLTNPSDTKRALDAVERYLSSVIRQRRIASPDLMSAYPEEIEMRIPRGGQPAAGAGAAAGGGGGGGGTPGGSGGSVERFERVDGVIRRVN
jgi:hypothetical protein